MKKEMKKIKKILKKIISVSLLTGILLANSSCVLSSNVVFHTGDIEGASVYIDGELAGTTPFRTKMSNSLWSDPDIVITKDGYKKIITTVKKDAVVSNVVIGAVFNPFALLWCYGPKSQQNFELEPLTQNEQANAEVPNTSISQ